MLTALQPQYAFRTVVAMLQCFGYPFETLDATLKEEEQKAAPLRLAVLAPHPEGRCRLLPPTTAWVIMANRPYPKSSKEKDPKTHQQEPRRRTVQMHLQNSSELLGRLRD